MKYIILNLWCTH